MLKRRFLIDSVMAMAFCVAKWSNDANFNKTLSITKGSRASERIMARAIRFDTCTVGDTLWSPTITTLTFSVISSCSRKLWRANAWFIPFLRSMTRLQSVEGRVILICTGYSPLGIADTPWAFRLITSASAIVSSSLSSPLMSSCQTSIFSSDPHDNFPGCWSGDKKPVLVLRPRQFH